MPKVTELPLSENYKPSQALDAAKMAELDDVIVIGRVDGEFFLTSSKMDCGQALYLLEHARLHSLGLIQGSHKC